MRLRRWAGLVLVLVAGPVVAMVAAPDWLATVPPSWRVVWQAAEAGDSVGSSYGGTLASTIAPGHYVRLAYDRAVVVDADTGETVTAVPLDPAILHTPEGSQPLYATLLNRGARRMLVAVRQVNSAGPRQTRHSATDHETATVWGIRMDGSIAWTRSQGPFPYVAQFAPVPFGPDQTALFVRADDLITVIDLDGRTLTEWLGPPPRRFTLGDFDGDAYPDLLVHERAPVRLRIAPTTSPEEQP